MKIDSYSFGKIVIEGKTYTSDVIIYPDHVDSSWWRKEGHYLQAVDLTDAVNANPDVLVIGTGNWGVMVVPKEAIDFIKSRGIEVRAEMTTRAVEIFNSLQGAKIVIAALHLTC
jgi:hypothetical protein